MRRIIEIAMRGRERRHPADFSSAHRVRLPGQRERSRAGSTDLSGREMQVYQGSVLRGPR